MKKIYIGLLALSLTGMLAACGGSSSDGYVIKEGDTVLSEQLMQANYNNNETKKSVSFESTKVEFPEGYEVSVRSADNGYAVLTKDSKYGFYSYLANKFIIDARLAPAQISSTNTYIAPNEQFGFTLKYKESNNKWRLIDGVGNVLYESSRNFTVNNSCVSYKTITDEKTEKDTLYARVVVSDPDYADKQNMFFKYDDSNVATKVDFAEYYGFGHESGASAEREEKYLDFSEEGLDYKVTYYGSYEEGYVIYVYNSSGNVQATFNTYRRASIVVVGKKLYVQHATGTDGLFEIEGKIINLETLKEESLDLPAMLSRAKKLVSVENEEHTYYAVTLEEVKDGRNGSVRTMIMDEKGKFHDDITNKNFVYDLRLTNGYFYVGDQEILYDASFNPVMHTTGYSFDRDNEIFYKANPTDSGYVFVNNEGKFIFETKYGPTYEYATLNKIYEGVDYSTGEQGFVNIADGSFYKLSEDTGKGTTAVIEETINSVLISKVTKTYNVDGEGERTTEDADKRSATLRTLDGSVLLNIEAKFVNEQFENRFFKQSNSINGVKKQYHHIRYYVAEEGFEYVIHNGLLAAQTVAEPAAAN